MLQVRQNEISLRKMVWQYCVVAHLKGNIAGMQLPTASGFHAIFPNFWLLCITFSFCVAMLQLFKLDLIENEPWPDNLSNRLIMEFFQTCTGVVNAHIKWNNFYEWNEFNQWNTQGLLNTHFSDIHLFKVHGYKIIKVTSCVFHGIHFAFKMTVFRWRSHEAVVVGSGYTAFTFEVVLKSSVSCAILGFVTDVHKAFEATCVCLSHAKWIPFLNYFTIHPQLLTSLLF